MDGVGKEAYRMVPLDTGSVQPHLGTLGQVQRPRRAVESVRSLPKIGPLSGSLHSELKRCGKANCHCARSQLHGPYWSHRWREGGRQRRRYVQPCELEALRARLSEWRRLHPPARSTRERLAELRRALRLLTLLED